MKLLYLIAISLMICNFSLKSFAIEVQKASDFAEGVVKVASQTASNKSTTKEKKISKLIDLFENTYDIKNAAKFVIGPKWKELSDTQKENFISVYKTYLVTAQTNNVMNFLSSGISYTASDAVQSSASSASVKFNINYKSKDGQSKSINLEFVIKENKEGELKVFDVVFEGISLLQSQRDEFSSVINNKGFEELVSVIKKKNQSK